MGSHASQEAAEEGHCMKHYNQSETLKLSKTGPQILAPLQPAVNTLATFYSCPDEVLLALTLQN